MKTYSDYVVSKTSQSGVFSAFKKNAANLNGVVFSHHFYFQYSNTGNCTVNGRNANEFAPSFNDNYFIACAKTGVVLSNNMETFGFQDNSLDYTNYEPISVEEIAKLDFNVEN